MDDSIIVSRLNIRERADLVKCNIRKEYEEKKGTMSRAELLLELHLKYGYAVSTIETKILYH
jgi:hypothetical protein